MGNIVLKGSVIESEKAKKKTGISRKIRAIHNHSRKITLWKITARGYLEQPISWEKNSSHYVTI